MKKIIRQLTKMTLIALTAGQTYVGISYQMSSQRRWTFVPIEVKE